MPRRSRTCWKVRWRRSLDPSVTHTYFNFADPMVGGYTPEKVALRRAVALGVRIAINTDAHRPEEFDNRGYGVATAQRGWATAADVVNTWPLDEFLALVQSKERRQDEA